MTTKTTSRIQSTSIPKARAEADLQEQLQDFELVSVFSELGERIARAMVQEGKAIIIAPTPFKAASDIPEAIQFNPEGDQLRLVILMRPRFAAELTKLILIAEGVLIANDLEGGHGRTQ